MEECFLRGRERGRGGKIDPFILTPISIRSKFFEQFDDPIRLFLTNDREKVFHRAKGPSFFQSFSVRPFFILFLLSSSYLPFYLSFCFFVLFIVEFRFERSKGNIATGWSVSVATLRRQWYGNSAEFLSQASVRSLLRIVPTLERSLKYRARKKSLFLFFSLSDHSFFFKERSKHYHYRSHTNDVYVAENQDHPRRSYIKTKPHLHCT